MAIRSQSEGTHHLPRTLMFHPQFRLRWLQFRLSSLLAFVFFVCIALGGLHLLIAYGQYVEAGPAVVGEPIKVRGRFFVFLPGELNGSYEFNVPGGLFGLDGHFWTGAKYSGWGRYEIDMQLTPSWKPGEYALRISPDGSRPIVGNLIVHPRSTCLDCGKTLSEEDRTRPRTITCPSCTDARKRRLDKKSPRQDQPKHGPHILNI
jgi:hypothetical protein